MKSSTTHPIPVPASLPKSRLLAAGVLASLAAGCSGGGSEGTVGPPVFTLTNAFDTLDQQGLVTLRQAIEAAGLEATFTGPGPVTLFAPSEAAFAALPAGELNRLLDPANVAELRALLLYHTVEMDLSAATLEGLTSVMSAQGADLLVDAPGGVLFVNEARVTGADVEATNGTLHIVDSVLVPPTTLTDTLGSRGFNILADLIDRAGLTGALTGGGHALLAPTDDAFNALPPGRLGELQDPMNVAELTALLEFHVIPGGPSALELLFNGDTPNLNGERIFACVHAHELRFNNIRSPRFNVPATDGLVHVLDAVLEPTERLRAVLDAQGLTILAGLVDQAGLSAALMSLDPRTLVAPTDAAFNALPAGELAMLQDPANVALREAFLQRHIVEDALQSVEIARRREVTMADGTTYMVETQGGLTLGGIPFATADVLGSNGIVHTVETVLP